MPVEEITNLTGKFNTAFGIKAFLILFLVFYCIFAMMLFRQIQLMSRTLPTVVFPLLKFLAIIHIGVSLAILFMVLGVF